MYLPFLLPVLILLLVLNLTDSFDAERILSYNFEGTRGWTEILVNTSRDNGFDRPKRSDAAQYLIEIKQTETARPGKGTHFNARRLKRTSLPAIVTSWNLLQLNTPLNNGYNQPQRYSPPQSVSKIFVAFSNYVQIITPTNGVYFQDSPYRPRTELSESTQWNCTSPDARHDMNFSMIVDELPNPTLAVKVSHSQLFKVLQVQSRILGGLTNIVLEVNGRWTSDRITWVIQLSNPTLDMRGKLFTTSMSVSNGTVSFSYQDETGQLIPLTQIVGLNTIAAGSCKYTTGNYLQIYQDARKLPVQYAKSRLFKFSVVTSYPLAGVVRTNVP